MTTETQLTASQVMVLMRTYAEQRAEAKRHADVQAIAAKAITDYLHANGGELYDGETKLKAWLQDRKGQPECDFLSMAADEPSLVQWMAEHGLLRLDTKAFEAMDGKAPQMLRIRDYLAPGPGSQALQVREDR